MFRKHTDGRVFVWKLYEDGQDRLKVIGIPAVRRARAEALWRYITLGLGADLPLLLTDGHNQASSDPVTEEMRKSGWTARDIEAAVDDLADADLMTVEPAPGPVPLVIARVKGGTK